MKTYKYLNENLNLGSECSYLCLQDLIDIDVFRKDDSGYIRRTRDIPFFVREEIQYYNDNILKLLEVIILIIIF